MKQKYAVLVFLMLIVASAVTSFSSYRATEWLVEKDMSQALAFALDEQQSDVITADTIKVFNRHLQLDALRGQALLAVDTRQHAFRCEAQCSAATIFSMSEQRPALALCTLAMLWGMFCLYQHRRQMIEGLYGGLALLDGRIVDAKGSVVKLTPMQLQLMEMFFRSPNHSLSKTEICDTLWPKKDDASETLYTLIRRLKPIIEAHSDLKIEADRGKAYELKIK